MRNASDVASTPTRLRSTSAWLRIWIVATSATSRAISHTLMPRVRPGVRRGDLRGLDIGDLEARVICRQPYVWASGKSQLKLELDFAGADVRQRGRICQGVHHPVAIADCRNGDRRRERGTLVDHDLAFGTREGRQRSQ